VSYRVVAHLQEKAVSVSAACRVLEVSRSGYYAQACHAEPNACTSRPTSGQHLLPAARAMAAGA